MTILNKISKIIKYGLLGLIISPLLIGNFSNAQDVMHDLFQPSKDYETIFNKGDTKDSAGKYVLEGYTTDNLGDGQFGGVKEESLVVKVTKFLLSLVVALSITMIIYNGLQYIIQTGNGKEGKDLVKNILYIVIGIIVALLSSTIITLIESVPTTLDKEIQKDTGGTAKEIMQGESWGIGKK